MKDWKKAVVNQKISLRQAIEVLDAAALRIVLVVDEHMGLLGTITDGDIRRALLKHLSLDTSVTEIMNRHPQTADGHWSKEKSLAVMEKRQLLQLPVVSDGKLTGLLNLHDLVNKQRFDNPVFLMAGGFGTRLRPLTENCPKPMLKVGNKPILEQILLNFVDSGFYRFYISTHYMPEVIRDHFGNGDRWGVSIEYIHENVPLGTAGALGLLPTEARDKPIFVMNGDLLTTLSPHSLLEFHQDQNSSATMCVSEYDYQVPFGVITSEGTQIQSIVEKPVHKFFINAGIYLLEPKLVNSVESGVPLDMPTLFEQAIANSEKISMFPIHEYWLDIGRIDDFKRAQALASGQLNG